MAASTRVTVDAHPGGVIVLRVSVYVDGTRTPLKQLQAPLTLDEARAACADLTRAIEEAECPALPRSASSAKR